MAEAEHDIQPEGKLWLLVILALVVFASSLVYFGRRNPGLADFSQATINKPNPSRQARVYTVYYNTGVFSPTNLRVHAGDSVKFQNDSDKAIHVTADKIDGVPVLTGFDSIGDVPSQSSFVYTFTKAGVFGYHNQLDISDRGTVIVRP